MPLAAWVVSVSDDLPRVVDTLGIGKVKPPHFGVDHSVEVLHFPFCVVEGALVAARAIKATYHLTTCVDRVSRAALKTRRGAEVSYLAFAVMKGVNLAAVPPAPRQPHRPRS